MMTQEVRAVFPPSDKQTLPSWEELTVEALLWVRMLASQSQSLCPGLAFPSWDAFDRGSMDGWKLGRVHQAHSNNLCSHLGRKVVQISDWQCFWTIVCRRWMLIQKEGIKVTIFPCKECIKPIFISVVLNLAVWTTSIYSPAFQTMLALLAFEVKINPSLCFM